MTNTNDLRRKALIGKSALGRVAAAIQYADHVLAKAGNKAKYKVGWIVVMTDDAIENYGEEWRDVPLRITSVATKYMPSKQFFAQGKPEGYHPGYDDGAGGGLYDLERVDGGKVNMSLYDWELTLAPDDADKAARPAFRKAAFKPGDKVYHKKYGTGTVDNTSAGPRGDQIGVLFDNPVQRMMGVMPVAASSLSPSRTVGGDSTKPQGYIVGRKSARPAMRKAGALNLRAEIESVYSGLFGDKALVGKLTDEVMSAAKDANTLMNNRSASFDREGGERDEYGMALIAFATENGLLNGKPYKVVADAFDSLSDKMQDASELDVDGERFVGGNVLRR